MEISLGEVLYLTLAVCGTLCIAWHLSKQPNQIKSKQKIPEWKPGWIYRNTLHTYNIATDEVERAIRQHNRLDTVARNAVRQHLKSYEILLIHHHLDVDNDPSGYRGCLTWLLETNGEEAEIMPMFPFRNE